MEEKGGQLVKDGATGGQVDGNGQPITDYASKYDMTADAVAKMKEKFNRKEKDFLQPQTEAEKEYVLDTIIAQLLEVKNGQWGKPVKLD